MRGDTSDAHGDGGAADGQPHAFEMVLAADVLPAAVMEVLTAAYDLTKSTSMGLDDNLTTGSVRKLLDTFTGYPALRNKIRADLASRDHSPAGAAGPSQNDGTDAGEDATLAAGLVALADDVAGRAAEKVRQLLDNARTEARNARGTAKRQARPDAQTKAADRERALLDQARAQRDQARRKLEAAEARLAEAHERVESLADDLDETRGQLLATEHQLAGLRTSLLDLPTAAQRLRDALSPTPTTRRSVVTEPRDSAAELAPAPGPADRVAADILEAAEYTLADVMDKQAREGVNEWLPRLLDAIVRPPRLEKLTELALTVDVLGGGDEIGGSCVLITGGGTRILVDCGTRPSGNDEASMAPPHIHRALAERLDAIVITHAHNDHGGWVPAVIRHQGDIPVFATRATCDLLTTMWNDAARVLRSQVETSRWQGGPLPPYSQEDVHTALDRLRDVPVGRLLRVGALEIELFDAGHIVGAAGVVVTAGEHRVVVTGDVSGNTQQTVGGFRECESARFADLVLLESTYAGQQAPAPRHQVEADFVRSAQLTLEAGGIALVPSFALGRAQEVALMCAEYLPDAEVLIDGLARAISETYEDYPGPDGSLLKIFGGNVRAVERGKTVDERIRLKSGIVIATSGMLSAGSPAVTWAQRVLPDPASAVMLVGYQDPESPGAQLRGLTRGSTFNLSLRDGGSQSVHVHAKVEQFHLGAHANANELVGIADRLHPRKLMLVHGERRNQLDLANKMMQRGHSTMLTDVWMPHH